MQGQSLNITNLVNQKFYSSRLSFNKINKCKEIVSELLISLNPDESEEHNKNLIRDFFINLGYKSSEVNTSGNIDLSISNNGHNNVIIETKDFKNNEMISQNNINKKAIHELIFYFMREYILKGNNHITYLIATTGVDWFIFDAKEFKKLFIDDKSFVNEFKSSINKSLTDSSTNNFYKNIAQPKVESIKHKIHYFNFNFIREFNGKKISNNLSSNVYKLFSPVTMFKQTFTADSNALNINFYNELLYIMGLREKNSSGEIERIPKGERQRGSLIEQIYIAIDGTRKANLSSPRKKFDDSVNIAMSFINRLLFLKLLEGQLIRFNNNNNKYKFLNDDKIQSFSDLDDLYFKVLATPIKNRFDYLNEKYPYVPYLNSSLFEKTEIEKAYDISPIKFKDGFSLRIFKSSILKKRINKDVKEKKTLYYLLDFLNSYSFNVSDKSFNDQEIINSSILGSIFEKINGYREGAFFTPGFVTSYMAETSIHKALIKKFNRDGFNISKLNDLMGENKDILIRELNDFHLVDPAVGSGHFLVSSLNYLVKIRNDLGLINPQLNNMYNIRIVNDELFIDNEELNKSFYYIRGSNISTEIQKSIFNTKKEIIENNLFGVDINQNSVNITKLRLWIELLKDSYYENGSLVTMPNLEMNIKSGNSLISKYTLNEVLSNVSQGTNITVSNFKKAVSDYKNTSDKNKKYNLELDIKKFENSIIKSINKNSIIKQLDEAYQKYNETKLSIELFDSKKIKDEKKKTMKNAHKKINNLEQKFNKLNNNDIFKNSFEWRFEFPELLNNEGEFIGFDLVIANPPYINMDNMRTEFNKIKNTNLGIKYSNGRMNIFYYFIHLAIDLLNSNYGVMSFITTNYWLTNDYADKLRNDIKYRCHIFRIVDFSNYKIFNSAKGQHNLIIEATKGKKGEFSSVIKTKRKEMSNPVTFNRIVQGKDNSTDYSYVKDTDLYDYNGYINLSIGANKGIDYIVENLNNNFESLHQHVKAKMGIQAVPNKAFIVPFNEYDSLKNELTPFEISLMKPLINCSSINKYFEDSNFDSYMMYITNDINLSKIPHLINYMLRKSPDIKNKAKNNTEKNFYALHRPRNLNIIQDSSTIFAPQISVNPNFMFNNMNYVIKNDVRFIYAQDDSIDSSSLILLLNSTLSIFIWHYYGITRGSSIVLKESALNVIPLPPKDKIDTAQVQSIINKMKKYNDPKLLQDNIDEIVNDWFNISKNQFKSIINYIN